MWLQGCDEIVMWRMKGWPTAAIHQPSKSAGSAERTEAGRCCRYWDVVDGVIRALKVSVRSRQQSKKDGVCVCVYHCSQTPGTRGDLSHANEPKTENGFLHWLMLICCSLKLLAGLEGAPVPQLDDRLIEISK